MITMLDNALSQAMEETLERALAEDIGQGDVTSQLLVPAEERAEMQIVSRETICVCGTAVAAMVFRRLGADIAIKKLVNDGDIIKEKQVIMSLSGAARDLLAGERVLLNLMQRMSGVATLTRRYADAIAHTKAVLLDTRKTMPGLRLIDKYAARTGGAQNHRMRLDDMVLIKDNHIALCGGVARAIEKARTGLNKPLPIVVECDTLSQVQEALKYQPDRLLLDNMSNQQLAEAVKLSGGKIPLEASGGVNLSTIASIAETGVDFISVGAITHSAPAVDIGADIGIGAG